jgi:hypothetical protein
MSTGTATPGLVVTATDPIRSFLSSAAASPDLAADLRDLASALSSAPAVPYRSIRAIWCADSSPARPPLRQLLQGAQFVLSSPKPREKVSHSHGSARCQGWCGVAEDGLLILL